MRRCHRWRRRVTTSGRWWCSCTTDSIIRCLLVLTYLVYPTVSSMLFQAFSCEQVHLGRFLHYDYAIDCDSAEHKRYQSLAITAILFFALGVPLMFWVLLYSRRHNLAHEDAQYLDFFFGDYNEDHWYWEVIECFRKLVLTGVALFFGKIGPAGTEP